MRKLTVFFLCVTVFTIPWEEFYSFPGIGGLARLLGYATLFAALLALAYNKTIRPVGAFHYILILFVFWNLITIFWSVDANISFAHSMTFIRVGGLFWLIYEFAWKENEGVWLIRSYLLGCLLTISQVSFSYFRKDYLNIETGGRLTALGMNQNDLALVLDIGAGLAYYLFMANSGKHPLWRVLYAIFIPLAIIAMLMTGSRSGIISLIFGVFYIIIVQRRMGLRNKLILAAGVLAIFFLSQQVLTERMYERFRGTGAELSEGSWSQRKYIWEAGLSAFDVRPLLGYGSGTFRLATVPFGNEQAPHNAYLAVLVESGIIGFFFFMSLFILAIYYTAYIPVRSRGAWRAVLLMCMVGIFSMGWDYRKPPWLLFGLIINQCTLHPIFKRR